MQIIRYITLSILAVWGPLISLQAQAKKPASINDVFLQYVTKSLELQPEEVTAMRPLVRHYLVERKKLSSRHQDPLEREQQILNLKKRSRAQMARVVGMQKANAFFTSEQTFRRKVRDELKNRKQRPKKN